MQFLTASVMLLLHCLHWKPFVHFSKEMEKAKSKKMKYDFGNFLLISKTYKLSKLSKKGKKKNRSGQQDTVTFVNAEEELFFKVSTTVTT